MKYRSQWPTNILRSDVWSYWLIIPKYDVQSLNNFLECKITGPWNIDQCPTNILRSYWLIIPKYGVHISNSLQDIRQNNWTMKYRSQWPTFILRLNVVSYWLMIPKYDVHTSNRLQHIRQNHWTIKYGSQWPTFILRSNVGSYWLTIPSMMFIHQSSRYKAKSLDHEMQVTVAYIYFEVTLRVIMTRNPKVRCSYIK